MNNLILHCGAQRVSREDLRYVPTPLPTTSHKPVPHIQIANLIANEAQNRGYEIESEEYGLSPNGSKMFGVLKFYSHGNPEYTRALGFRNSHDKSIAVGLTVGLKILCCDNGCFGGEIVIHRKHTIGLEIEELIPKFFTNLPHHYIRLEENVDSLKMQSVSIDEARLITVQAAEDKAINSSDIIPVLDEFRNPQHDEFAIPTKWSLYNAFTELAKKYTPARADFCYRKLGVMFGLT